MRVELLIRPRPQRTALTVGAIFFGAIAICSGLAAFRHFKAVESEAAELSHLQATRKKPTPYKPSPAEVEVNKRWRAMQAELAFSWYPIFRALESANSPDIELLEFLPDKIGMRIVLRGEARDQGALTNYINALAAQPVFSELYLAHQKIDQRQGMEILTFEVRSKLAE